MGFPAIDSGRIMLIYSLTVGNMEVKRYEQ